MFNIQLDKDNIFEILSVLIYLSMDYNILVCTVKWVI